MTRDDARTILAVVEQALSVLNTVLPVLCDENTPPSKTTVVDEVADDWNIEDYLES